ncbi:MAG TPA: tetratricopeptide repeat protein, partial [Methanocorpusculum sp.]|nr:tetratricopeptide repeat protein [Methanocorpusculum sp.]
MGGLFSKGEKQNPWITRGEQAFEKQQFENACSHYAKAVEFEPENIKALARLAHLQQYTGKYNNALETYRKVVSAEPENQEAWTQIALLEGEAGNYSQAISAIEHVTVASDDTFILTRKCEWVARTGNYRDAADIAKQLSLNNPQNEQYALLYADNLMRSGQNSDAKDAYCNLMKRFPDRAVKYANDAALCAELMGENNEAYELYKSHNSQDALGLFRKARLEELSCKFTDAASTYSAIQRIEGTDEIHITFRRIYCLFWGGKEKEAAAELEKLLSRNLDSGELWYLLGSISFMTGSIQRAAECFEHAIRAGAGSGWMWQMKATAEFFSGKYSDALSSFSRTKNIREGKSSADAFFEGEEMELIEKVDTIGDEITFSEANPNLAAIEACCLAAAGKAEQADSAALSALAEDPTRIDMEILHLRLLAASGRYQACAEAGERVSKMLPDDYTILFEHAEAEMLSGNFTKAAEIFRKLMNQYPENPMLYGKLITCIVNSSDFAAAKEAADGMITMLPDNAEVIRAAADASFAAGAYTDAATYYNRVCELQPENGHAFLCLGKSYEMLGKYADAKEAFSTASAYLAENIGTVFLQALCAADGGQLEEAAALYTSIIQTYPDLRGPAGELALISAALGRHKETEAAVSITAALGDADYTIYKLGGDACMQLLRYDDAITYYTEALAIKPGDVPVTSSLGRAYAAKGDYEQGLAAFNDALSSEPESTGLLMAKAQCKANLGHWEEAETDLRTITSQDPENPEPYLVLAEVLERQQKYPEMLDAYISYLKIQPENISVFRKIANLYLMDGNYEEAINGYDMILEAHPNDRMTMNLKAEALMALGCWKESAELCATILSFYPDDQAIRLMYAKGLSLIGEYKKALSEYVTILKADRTNTEALLGYGDLLSRTGNYDKALIAFDRIIKNNNTNLNAYLERTNAAIKQGKPETILASLKASVSATAGNPHMLSGLGYLSAIAGRPSEALTFLDKAEKAGGDEVDIFNTRALIYLSQNQYDKALEAAIKATTGRPENTTAWRLRAQAHERLGQIEEAIECYQNSLTGKQEEEDPFAAPAEPVVRAKKTMRPTPMDDDFQPTYTDDDDIVEIEEEADTEEASDDFEPVGEKPVSEKKTTTRKA